MLIAEGSDWFWWYGDDHSSDHDLEFDDLFRRHLRNVYRLLRQAGARRAVRQQHLDRRAAPAPRRRRSALLAPTLDGEETSYFEWLGAGVFEVLDVAGRDAPDRAGAGIASDARAVRVRPRAPVRPGRRPAGRWPSCWPTGYEVALKFLHARRAARSRCGRRPARLAGGVLGRGSASPRVAPIAVRRRPRSRAGTILELALPLADLGPGAPDGRWRSSSRSTTQAASNSSGIRRTGRSSSTVPDERVRAPRHWRRLSGHRSDRSHEHPQAVFHGPFRLSLIMDVMLTTRDCQAPTLIYVGLTASARMLSRSALRRRSLDRLARSAPERSRPAADSRLFRFLRRSRMMASSASMTSSRDARLLRKLQLQVERLGRAAGRQRRSASAGPACGLAVGLAQLLARRAALARRSSRPARSFSRASPA